MSRVELGNGADKAVARCFNEGTVVRERCGAAAIVSGRVKSRQRRHIGSSWDGESGGVGREEGWFNEIWGRVLDGSGGGLGREVMGTGGGDGGVTLVGWVGRTEGRGEGEGIVALGGGGSRRREVVGSET